jgi:hypothetical protein
MSLLATVTDPAAVRASAMRAHLVRTLDLLRDAHRRGMALMWEVEGSTGPQQVFDQFGGQAAELFVHGSALVQFIQGLDPLFVPSPIPFEFTINEDGTVTVGEPVAPEPAPE